MHDVTLPGNYLAFMSMKGHKRKRSINDTPIDLTKMQTARQRLLALQEESEGIEETELEMAKIMCHVDALQDILGSSKKLVSEIATGVHVSRLRCSETLVFIGHLNDIGVQRKPLRLNNEALTVRISASSTNPKHFEDLCSQITRIRRSTSKRVSYFRHSGIVNK